MKIDDKVIGEVERQVGGLMDDHRDRIQRSYELNGQEIEMAFKVTIKSENPAMDIKTDISYLPVPKVKDSAHGRVTPLPLFDVVENQHDRRTRLHTLWMIQGGEVVKGKFDNYLKRLS